ncbi:MAG: RsmE family RNA methyltransferase [Candidatus Babeliaceae bacterium]
MLTEKHIFAFYFPTLSVSYLNEELSITSSELVYRMQKVLRLSLNDTCIFFNEKQHALFRIKEIEKNYITGFFISFTENKPLQPFISCLLPLLKREAFEEALSFLTSLGVTTIQPFISEKTHHNWIDIQQTERFKRIMIAASEQSKQFMMPTIKSVLPLKQILEALSPNTNRIFFDAQGISVRALVQQSFEKTPTEIICAFGPEADLTNQEKQFMKEQAFIFCKLTPTILRTEQACAVGIGIVRCWYPL